MPDELKTNASLLLTSLASELDISDTQYKAAVERYQAVGNWLGQVDSEIVQFEPAIYPQGSFLLGTVVKPISDGDEYDIDLVCELKNLRTDIGVKKLKELIGNRLKKNEAYKRMLEEPKPRCWTLTYSETTRFHMDILPAISDSERAFLARKAGTPYTTDPIWIADEKMQKWLQSNPKGFAEWFKTRMKPVALFKEAKIEDVPANGKKTTLQRVVQLLKRHRDIMFEEDKDDKPISVIITTLAAHAYNNEDDLLEALLDIVNQMQKYIENRDGVLWVPNPVNENENFADKWQQYPQRESKFRVWLNQVRTDINSALQKGEIRAVTESLKPRFGDRMINLASSKAFPSLRVSDNRFQQSVPIVNIEKPSKPWGM